MPLDQSFMLADVSRDGSAVALLRRDEAGQIGVWISSPPGAAPKKYEPAPFEARGFLNIPLLIFSPDARQLLLSWTPETSEVWLLPYPPDRATPPRRILDDLVSAAPLGTMLAAWMPDSRHLVAGTKPADAAARLYIADTVTGRFRALSSGTRDQIWPAVSPDSDKLAFVEGDRDFDIVTVDLKTAGVTPLIATNRSEQMPSWSAATPALVYVTDRNEGPEIWLHERDQPDRPLVTARDFPQGATQWFMGPELSPDGSRVIYLWGEAHSSGPARLWMSAVAGGGPVPLVPEEASVRAFTGTWSPDGNWYVYRTLEGGVESIRKVRTSGQGQSEILKSNVRRAGAQWVPIWSPRGDWILYPDVGNKLMSVDGRTTRDLGPNAACAFARDGRRLYCLRDPQPDGSRQLVSLDLDKAGEQMIGRVPAEYVPNNGLAPALHLTLTPDGSAITYSVLESSTNLWLVEGLDSVPLP
jgi:Tol biopolymer transport system component